MHSAHTIQNGEYASAKTSAQRLDGSAAAQMGRPRARRAGAAAGAAAAVRRAGAARRVATMAKQRGEREARLEKKSFGCEGRSF